MTATDLNNQINLQAFCEANGEANHTFIRLPRFGWYATDKKDGTVRSLVDFLPLEDLVAFCTDLILEKRQYHENRILYNEVAIVRLTNDIRILLATKQFYKECVTELLEGQAFVDGRYLNLAKMFEANGMDHFLDTGIGLATEPVLKKFQRQISINVSNLRNKLVVPSWSAPGHFSSLEYCKIDQPGHRKTFYVNGEKGWYGKLHKKIYGNFVNLVTHQGCTWDPKIDYWADKALDLDESLDVKQCLQIWSEAKNLELKKSPLDMIQTINGVGKIRMNVGNFTLSQVKELEKKFDQKYEDLWVAQKQAEIQIGHVKFVQKNMRYYYELQSEGVLREYTNFAIEITKIRKVNGIFVREGILYYEGKQTPFELENTAFLTARELRKELDNFFFNRGIGIPLVAQAYSNSLPEVINRFNLNCLIDPTG